MTSHSPNDTPLVAQPDWERLMSLFEELVDLPSEQQATVIAQKQLNQATQSRLEQMLRTLDHTLSILDTPLSSRIRIPHQWQAQQWVGRMLNQYQLDELLHEGNIAAVFSATQLEPVKRRVAIKLIRPEVSSQYRENFRSEQRAMARLSHPSIGSIFTVEESEDGLSFSVMEYIEGRILSTYCDEEQLSVRDRLGLFLDICDAVSYAHQRGILHRDLKSSNILVRNFDGKPTPTVIDLEISSDLNDQIEWPEDHVMGTPEYMSPEHVLHQNDMDVRADVYSMGMVLFTLLAGSLPFDRDRLARMNRAQRLTLIAEFETALPAVHLKRMSRERREQIAQQRGTTASSLVTQVSSELESIFSRATQKDREKRYPTIAEFAQDIRHFLDGKAVKTHSSSTWYSVRKWVARNAVLSAAAAAVTALSAVFALQLMKQNEAITEQAVQVEQAQYNADKMAEMIVKTLDIAEPESANSLGRESVSAMVDNAFAGFRSTEGASPELRAQLLLKLSGAFSNTENKDKALEVEQMLLDELSTFLPDTQAKVLVAVSFSTLTRQEFSRGLELAKRVESMYPSDDLNVLHLVKAKRQKANALRALSRLDEATVSLNEGLSLIDKHDLQDKELQSTFLYQSAFLAQLRGDFERSFRDYSQAVATLTQLYGADDKRVASAQVAEFQALMQGKSPRANSDNARRLLQSTRRIWGEDSNLPSFMYYILAQVLHDEGDLDAARTAFEGNLKRLEQYGRQSEELYITNLAVLSRVYLDIEEPALALQFSFKAFNIASGEVPGSTGYAPYLVNAVALEYANVLAANNRADEALPLLASADEFFSETLPGEELFRGLILSAFIATNSGRHESARLDIDRAHRYLDSLNTEDRELRLAADVLSGYIGARTHVDRASKDTLSEAFAAYRAVRGERPLSYPFTAVQEYLFPASN